MTLEVLGVLTLASELVVLNGAEHLGLAVVRRVAQLECGLSGVTPENEQALVSL